MIRFDIWHNWAGPKNRRHRPNYTILTIVLALLAIGALVQFTISPALVARAGNVDSWGGTNAYFYRHLAAIGLGCLALWVGFKVHIIHWLRWSPRFLLVGLILALIASLLQTRWLTIGWLSIQPVEIIKVFLILVLTGYIIEASNKPNQRFLEGLIRNRYSLGLMMVTGLLFHNDLGSLVVLLAIAMLMFLVGNLSWRFISGLATLAVATATLLIIVTSYRLDRLVTFLGDSCSDYLDRGYHVCQALIGISSGGLWGKGWGRSVQVFGYLPEVTNDSIFAIYAEISGFFGALILLGLFFWLFKLIYNQIGQLEDRLLLIVTGFLAWLTTQSVINIGSMLDLLPVKGITLPFISLGGSSLVMVLLMTGIVLQISAYSHQEGPGSRPGVISRSWLWWSRYRSRDR